MNAFDRFNESVLVVQALWDAQQEAGRAYRRQLAETRIGDEASRQLVSAKQRLWHAMVQAAAVRLSTAWEVFLHDLFREYLKERPKTFKAVWSLKGTVEVTEKTITDWPRGSFKT